MALQSKTSVVRVIFHTVLGMIGMWREIREFLMGLKLLLNVSRTSRESHFSESFG